MVWVSESELFLVTHSTGETVEYQDLFPEFELFVGMGSILVSCSLAVRWIFRAYFQNLNFFVGNGFDHRH
jgi:hypothetical protein